MLPGVREVGGPSSGWEQRFLASVCVVAISVPSFVFLDGMFDYLSEGKGVAEANKHVTKFCFVFHPESHVL